MADLLFWSRIVRSVGVSLLCMLYSMYMAGALHAQEVDNIQLDSQRIQISYWRQSHGLPTWHIRDMVRGPRGMIWMATDQGLISLDGKKFSTHTIPTTGGVLAKDLYRLFLDPLDHIWLFYRSGDSTEVYIYDLFQNETIPLASYIGKPLALSAGVMPNICSVNDTLWILDPGNRYGGYFTPSGRWYDALQDSSRHEERLNYFPASRGKFWAVNQIRKELLLINQNGAVLERYPFPNVTISSFWVGKTGVLYLTYASPEFKNKGAGILSCKEGAGLIKVTEEDRIYLDWGNGMAFEYNSLPLRANNKNGIEIVMLWKSIDLYDRGRLIYPGLDEYLKQKHRITPENAVFLLEDQTFWLFANNALIRLEILPTYFTSLLQNLPQPLSTRGLAVVGDSLYINSYQGHLALDLRSKKWGPVQALNRYPLGLALQLHRGELWSGHHGNIVSVYAPGTGKTRFYPLKGSAWNYETNHFLFTGSEEVYLGTAYGLFRFRPSLRAFEKVPMDYPKINCFYKNAHGIWLGTSKGLFLLNNDPSRKGISPWPIFPLVISADVRHIYEDEEGVFWLATEEGMWRWRPFSPVVEVFDQQEAGLPSNRLHAIYGDHHGRLWISSDGGITCFDKSSHQVHTFTISDGLASTELNYLSHCRDEKGRLYFGSVSGITYFNPDHIVLDHFRKLALFVSSLELRAAETGKIRNLTRELISSKKPIRVPYHTDQVTLTFFTAVFAGEIPVYRWRIPEFDSTWYTLSEPRFELYHPPFGEYSIEIEVYIPGNSLLQPATLHIPLIVERPYYLHTDFLVFVAILLSFLIMGIFRWRQENLRKLSEKLAEEVAEKTKQLKQDRDVIAQQAEELRQLDEEKTRFFQEFSHEIRNPLTLISGPTSELLKQKDLPDAYRNKLERIKRNSVKIMSLIEEVLELTRLEAGVVPLTYTVLELHPFLVNLCKDFDPYAHRQGIILRLDEHLPDGFKIQTDAKKLEKVLSNLIENALKYTPKGGSVVVQVLCLPGPSIRFVVQDTGVGIAPEHLDKIFQRYYQVPSKSMSSYKKGFGIGLAMCRSYVTLLGGEIHAESVPGQGTSVWAILPYTEPLHSDSPAHPNAPSTHASGDLVSDWENKNRILIVDDEPEVLEYLSGLLSEHYDIMVAPSGEEALDFLSMNPVGLIISDLIMSKMSGLDLLKRIRKDGVNRQTPFILLTGYTSKDSLQQAVRLGCNGHLNKPINEQQLWEMVNQLLRMPASG